MASKINHQGSGTLPKKRDPKSNRTKRRIKRNFNSLEVSSRKHRRAKRRLYSNSVDSADRQHDAKDPGKVNFH